MDSSRTAVQVIKRVALLLLAVVGILAFVVFWGEATYDKVGTARAIGMAVGMAVSCYIVLSIINGSRAVPAGPVVRYVFPAALAIAVTAMVLLLSTSKSDPDPMSDSELVKGFKAAHIHECIISSRNSMTEEVRFFCKCSADKIASAFRPQELLELRKDFGYRERPWIVDLSVQCRS